MHSGNFLCKTNFGPLFFCNRQDPDSSSFVQGIGKRWICKMDLLPYCRFCPRNHQVFPNIGQDRNLHLLQLPFRYADQLVDGTLLGPSNSLHQIWWCMSVWLKPNISNQTQLQHVQLWFLLLHKNRIRLVLEDLLFWPNILELVYHHKSLQMKYRLVLFFCYVIFVFGILF